MEAQLKLLRTLQDLDLEIHEINAKTERLRDSLDELQSTNDVLQEGLSAQKQQLDDARTLMRDKERELDENIDRYNQSKTKLNAVANTKQYNALEKEMDTLKKMRAQLEEERDTLRENVESFEADVNEKQAKINAIDSQIREEQGAIDAEAQGGLGRIADLTAKRESLKRDIPKEIVRRYEFILNRRPGRAVVPAIKGTCRGCHMMLPPQLFNELQVGRKFIQCPNCQRILYYQQDDGSAGN